MTYKFKATHFHSIIEKDGKMYYRDFCDCGCQDFTGNLIEGDIVVSNIHVYLHGNLKRLTIYSNGVFTRNCNLIDVKMYPILQYKEV
jgi:hypothetical protein